MDDWRCLRISVGYSRLSVRMAGEVGFEPTNGGSKGRCLTTWRLPTKLLSLILKRQARVVPWWLPGVTGSRYWQPLLATVTGNRYLQPLMEASVTDPAIEDPPPGQAFALGSDAIRLHSNRYRRQNGPCRYQRSQRSSSRCPTSKRRVRRPASTTA